MQTTYDLIIIGAGPAGSAAAVYAARKQLKTLLIAKEWGGQSIVSEDIQNWIGTPHIHGADLAKNLKEHVLAYKGDCLDVQEGSLVSSISGSYGDFTVILDNGTEHKTKSILISTGSLRRKLDVLGANEYENKGLTYCASCDGPMFSGQPVAVIGGGNAAFESAAQLLAYCPTVYLLNRSEHLRAEAITINALKQNPNFKLLLNAVPKEVHGDMFVNGITYTDATTNTDVKLDVAGIFVEIGQLPSTDFVADAVSRDANNKIIIDPWTNQTQTRGIWAAGDCTNILYHQNNIAAGEAVKAVEDIYVTLMAR